MFHENCATADFSRGWAAAHPPLGQTADFPNSRCQIVARQPHKGRRSCPRNPEEIPSEASHYGTDHTMTKTEERRPGDSGAPLERTIPADSHHDDRPIHQKPQTVQSVAKVAHSYKGRGWAPIPIP